jgi:hypothetical protein
LFFAEPKQEEFKQKSGYWTNDDQSNVIRFFDNFAHERNGNPHDPNFWYTVKRSEVKEGKVCFHITPILFYL